MPYAPPPELNIADYFLDSRIREGAAQTRAIIHNDRSYTYGEISELANKYGNALLAHGVLPEQRVIIAMPDCPEYVAALFAILKIGAVVVMLNPDLPQESVDYFLEYTRAAVVLVRGDAPAVQAAAKTARHLKRVVDVSGPEHRALLEDASDKLESFPSHRDDAAFWLFSGGTTGKPKAVVQTHRSFANTTELYAKGILNIAPDDITISVPKLFFGYATGSNLLFPFSVGATSVLFEERCTAERLFEMIKKHRPTILINVPTMIQKLISYEGLKDQDLSCLRVATSAGEALPQELHDRWNSAFGIDLLDGLGTAEMWHIFVTNRPGDVKPGTLGKAVPGLKSRSATKRKRASAGRDRIPLGQGRLESDRLLAANGEDRRSVPRRVVRVRRHDEAGRRRLFYLLRSWR